MSKFITHNKEKSWKDLLGPYSLLPDPNLTQVGCGYPNKTNIKY